MIRYPNIFTPTPAPKPIGAARWVPLAKKHGMIIDFETKSVGTLTITEFFGSDWCSPDVGACVVKVAGMIDSSDHGTKLEQIGGQS